MCAKKGIHTWICDDLSEYSPKKHQNLEKTSLAVLYSNVHSLHQAHGELCKTCSELCPSIVCLTEMHLQDDATDNFCPRTMSLWLYETELNMEVECFLVQEAVLFEEINTSTIAISEKAELVVSCYDIYLFVVIASHLLQAPRCSLAPV